VRDCECFSRFNFFVYTGIIYFLLIPLFFSSVKSINLKSLKTCTNLIFILTIFFLITEISNAQQVISSNTSSQVIATGGDFTVNSGVTISASGANPVVSVLNKNVANFVNNGRITTVINDGNVLQFTSTATSSSIINNGTMNGKDGILLYSPAAITNNNSGSEAIRATNSALMIFSGSSGSSINNTSGTIWGSSTAITNYSGVTLSNITNASGATIKGNTAILNLATITNLTNDGTIESTSTNAISSVGSISNLTNRGTIKSAGGVAINHAITNLNNLQGSSNPLTITGSLPTNYNIIINSNSSYGKLSSASPSGKLNFGIYEGSVVSVGTTYQDVLTGVSASNLSSLTGTNGAYNWTLALDVTNKYDLTISRLTYSQTVTSPKIASTATQLEAIRTKGTKTTLINALDALSSTQLESALKKIQGTTTVKAAAQSVQAQSSFKTALSTVTSPGSSSSMTNVTKTNQGNLTFADLQKNNLYAKIQPANYSDDSAFFDYKNNQVPVNALEFFKSNRNVNLVEKDDFKESGIFLRTFGSITNYAAINSDDNSYGSDSYGLLGGFQHKIDENLYQGYSLGFSKSKLTLDAGEGNTKTNTIHANVYRKMDEKEYGVTASLGGYVSFIDNVRNISETNEILKSSPTNGGLDFSLQYVKKMELLGLNFYPSASLTTTYGIVENYKETGGSGSALEIKSHNVLAIKPEIGFTLENNFIQTDKITEGANFSLFANRQQYLDGHTNTSSMIGENSWSASTLPKTKDDFLTAGIGYVAKNIDEKSDLNFNFFYTQSTNNSLNSSLFSISYNKTF
jgi:hypothetical protein